MRRLQIPRISPLYGMLCRYSLLTSSQEFRIDQPPLNPQTILRFPILCGLMTIAVVISAACGRADPTVVEVTRIVEVTREIIVTATPTDNETAVAPTTDEETSLVAAIPDAVLLPTPTSTPQRLTPGQRYYCLSFELVAVNGMLVSTVIVLPITNSYTERVTLWQSTLVGSESAEDLYQRFGRLIQAVEQVTLSPDYQARLEDTLRRARENYDVFTRLREAILSDSPFDSLLLELESLNEKHSAESAAAIARDSIYAPEGFFSDCTAPELAGLVEMANVPVNEDAPPDTANSSGVFYSPSTEGTNTTNNYHSAMIGNASPVFPSPSGRDFDVIVLKHESGTLHIVVRNNTQQPVTIKKVDVTIKAGDGSLLAVEEEMWLDPSVVGPSEIAYGSFRLWDLEVPPDVQYEFDVEPMSPDGGSIALEIRDQSIVGERFLGMLYNPSSVPVRGPIDVTVLCFDTDGSFVDDRSDFTTKEFIPPGESIPYQVKVNVRCPTYLMWSEGFID